MYAAICPAASETIGACCQLATIDGRKDWQRSHDLSKRKMFVFGMLEDNDRRSGIRSKVSLGKEERVEKGKAQFSSLFEKTRSSLARIGLGCMLDQVKRRSESTTSLIGRFSIVSLKTFAREALNWALFLSAALRTRLKSSSRIQGPEKSVGP